MLIFPVVPKTLVIYPNEHPKRITYSVHLLCHLTFHLTRNRLFFNVSGLLKFLAFWVCFIDHSRCCLAYFHVCLNYLFCLTLVYRWCFRLHHIKRHNFSNSKTNDWIRVVTPWYFFHWAIICFPLYQVSIVSGVILALYKCLISHQPFT